MSAYLDGIDVEAELKFEQPRGPIVVGNALSDFAARAEKTVKLGTLVLVGGAVILGVAIVVAVAKVAHTPAGQHAARAAVRRYLPPPEEG